MELSRKFRVLGQTVSMHAALRDRYARRALIVDFLLLASSVVFCASAFASDDALSHFGPTPTQVRYIIRSFSVLAFMVSILSLRVGWKEAAARHQDAAGKLTRALAAFAKCRLSDGSWSEGNAAELDSAYWEAMSNSVPIPESAFVKLKAHHLKKVELSRMLDSNPGCPVLLLKLILLCSSAKRTFGRHR